MQKKIQILHELKKLGVDVRKITTCSKPTDFNLDADLQVLGMSAEKALSYVKQLRRDQLLTEENKAEIASTGFRLDVRDEKLKTKIELLESHKDDLVRNDIALRNWYAPAQYDKNKPPVSRALRQLRQSSVPAKVYYVQTMAFMTTLSADALNTLLRRGGAFTEEQFTLVLERSRKAVTHAWHMRDLKDAAIQGATINLRRSAIEEQMESLQSMDPPFGFMPANDGGERSFVENVLLWCDLKDAYPVQNGKFEHLSKGALKKEDKERGKQAYTWLYGIRKKLKKWISRVRKDVMEYELYDMETLFQLDLLRRHHFFKIYSQQDGVANTEIGDIKWLEEIFSANDISMNSSTPVRDLEQR